MPSFKIKLNIWNGYQLALIIPVLYPALPDKQVHMPNLSYLPISQPKGGQGEETTKIETTSMTVD